MARNPSTRWFAALAVLVVFVLLAWLLGAVLTLTEGERVTLRVVFVALGLVGAGALLWYLRPTDAPLPATGPARDDALTAVSAARARLPRGVFEARRLVLVAGADGSCKTTVVEHSGTDPELLAGEPAAGPNEPPPATAAANLWAVKDAVLAEAGGPVFADGERWRRFVRVLRAPRLAAALGRGETPPRCVVLCVSCDVFYAGDGGAQLDALAQVARERLAIAARELGVALPVYVLFTKADRVPHFEAWAAPLPRDEVRAPIGAALPFDAAAAGSDGSARAAAAGGYAERLTPRLEAAFAQIVSALAGRRLEQLGRESQVERRLEAYELPREIGKIAPVATRFLAELCRPMQLGVSPQLRGFYFVGARPVVVSDAAPAQAAAAPAAARARAADATSIFNAAALAAPAARAAYGASVSRRVPQWVFLERLFPDVVLADEGAAAAARGGVRVARLRRGLLATGIAALLLLSLGILRSAFGNRALADRTTAAARAVAALPVVAAPAGMIAMPSAEALRTLDGLRDVLDTLRGFQRNGVPMRLGFGLWQGGALLADGRRVWLDGYRRQLHATAWSALTDSLRALPDAPRPTDDYGRDYAMLRAYLLATAEPARSTPDFLAPVLLTSWARGQTLDADVAALARRQFEFYASELALANPWPQSADAGLVRHTRAFLGRFAGAEQIYQNMLMEANRAVPAERVAAVAPQAAGVIAGPVGMLGAFTAGGWRFMETAFRNADRYFEGERWVLGDAITVSAQDRDRIVAELRARYRADYVRVWRDFVRGLSVARPAATRDAAQKLGVLSSAQSPLLAELSLVARNTAVDSGVAAAFQPVQTVTPPGTAGKYISDGNQPYVTALVTLQGAVEQVANMPPAADTASALALAQAGQQALAQVTQAKVAARQMAQKFAVDTAAAQIAPAVEALLMAPIDGAEGVLRGVATTRPPAARRAAAAGGGGGAGGPGGAGAAAPAGGGANTAADAAALTAALNERGRALCSAVGPVLAKFPFNPDATTDASVAEVSAILAPGTGSLWAFQQERLGGLLEKQGGEWVAKPEGRVALSAPFVSFFNRAAQVSQALFNGGSEPRVVLTAHANVSEQMPEVTLLHGTQVARFDRTAPPAQLVWPAAAGRDAKLTAKFSGRFRSGERTIAQASGEWALFHLVAQAMKADGSGGSLHAEWNAKDQSSPPVAVDFTIASGLPVLRRGWLGGMVCAPQVTR